MFELRLLRLVLRYPQSAALARKMRDGSIIAALRQLEERGLVTRQRGFYRLTGRGKQELWMAKAVARLVARAR